MNSVSKLFSSVPKAIDGYESRLSIALFLFLLIALVVFPTGVIDGNETHYFMLADTYWDVQGEYSVVNEKSPHSLPFALLAGPFIDVFGYEAANAVLRILCAGLLAFGLAQLFFHWQLSALDALLIVASFVVFGQHFLGYEWIIKGFEGKVLAYAFVFVGLAKALEGKWLGLTVCMVIATYFHFLVGGFWTIIALIWLYNATESKGAALRSFTTYAVAILPLIIMILSQRMGQTSIVDGVDTFQIYAARVAHHIHPFINLAEIKEWMPGVVALFGCLVASIAVLPLATQASNAKVLMYTVIGLQAYLLLALVASASDTFVQVLGTFYVFRPSSLVLLLTITLCLLLYRTHASFRLPIWAAFLVIVPMAAWSALESKAVEFKHYREFKGEVNALIKAAESVTTSDDIVLIQPGRDGIMPESRMIRLLQRPTLMDEKFVPTKPATLLEWQKRMAFRESVFKDGCSNAYPVRALIIRNDNPFKAAVASSCGQTIFESENYSVIAVK